MQSDNPATGQIINAAAFAAKKHRDQRRKDAEASPYINHPIALADVLANEGGISDAVVLCAALLHDTIEDTETTAEELEQKFGSAIASVVLEVTDDKSLEKHVRKRRQIEHAPQRIMRARRSFLPINADKRPGSLSSIASITGSCFDVVMTCLK